MAGLAIMSVPLYWRIAGNYRNQQMVKEIEQIIEQETENEEEEDHGQTALEAAISEEDAAALSKEEVIGLIEIEALDIKYAVLEGAGSYELSCGIGHISDTAGIGEVGNCVKLCHNERTWKAAQWEQTWNLFYEPENLERGRCHQADG